MLDKIIEWIIFLFTFNLLWMTQTQEVITCRVLKFTNGYEGMCMSGGKFLKEWQVTDKIIESIFFQFTLNLLWMTQTQEIITHMVSKFMNGYEGMCMTRAKFFPEGMTSDR